MDLVGFRTFSPTDELGHFQCWDTACLASQAHAWEQLELVNLNGLSRVSPDLWALPAYTGSSSLHTLSLISPRLDVSTLSILSATPQLSKLLITRPDTSLSPLTLVDGLFHVPHLKSLSLHFCAEPTSAFTHPYALIPLLQGDGEEMNLTIDKIHHFCPELEHLDLVGPTVDVVYSMDTLPAKVSSLKVGTFGEVDVEEMCLAVLRKSRGYRSWKAERSGMENFVLGMRRGWTEEQVQTLRSAAREAGLVSCTLLLRDFD